MKKMLCLVFVLMFILNGCSNKYDNNVTDESNLESSTYMSDNEASTDKEDDIIIKKTEDAHKEDDMIIEKTDEFAEKIGWYMPFEDQENIIKRMRYVERELNRQIFEDAYYKGIEKLHILDYCKGKIGDNEYCVIVVEYFSPINQVSEFGGGYSRIVLLYKDNKFISKNTGIIGGSDTGGMFDPYSGTEFTENGFNINEYYGSRERVEGCYCFEVKEGEIIQTKYISEFHDTLSIYEATEDIYDFENGIHEKYKTDYEEPILTESIEKEKIDFENAHRYY